MIVYPGALVLSQAAAGAPLDYTRILYENVLRGLPVSSITASSETAGGPRDQPQGPETWTFWQGEAMPATWQANFGTFRDINAVGILGDLGSAGASVEAETSADAVEWDPLALEANPADDAPLLLLDDLRSAHHLRLTFTGAVAPRIAAIYAGKALAMELPPEAPLVPLPLSRVTERRHSMSRAGQFLGQSVRRRGVEADISFRMLTQSWVRQQFDPFVRAAQDYPYFIAWNPRAWPLEVGYVWTEEDIRPRHSGAASMDVGWHMEGVGNE